MINKDFEDEIDLTQLMQGGAALPFLKKKNGTVSMSPKRHDHTVRNDTFTRSQFQPTCLSPLVVGARPNAVTD